MAEPECQPGSPPRPGRRIDILGPAAVSVLALIALLGTSADFGMAWDEGYTVRRERLLDRWFGRVLHPESPGDRRSAFDKRELDRSWPFSREEPHGHPPFYALLGLAGWHVGHRWLSPLSAYRLGPMWLAAMTAGVIAHHLWRRSGRLAGLLAATLFLAMPRPFALAHYALYDMPMTCLWVLAQVAFITSLESRRFALLFGVALGLCAGTKFTGLFAVVPAVAWVAWVELWPRRGAPDPSPARPGLRSLAIAVPVAIVTLYPIQPPWWIEPLAGPSRFLASNLSRARTQPLATLYLGRVYPFSLPWHNTIVLTAVTTPVLVLATAMMGLAACLARRRTAPWALIWPLSWATLMVVRALPNAPGHDGIRLFLPSVASLAILAGLGVGWLSERMRTGWRRALPTLLAAATIGECLAGVAATYPYTDSYNNAAVGGLPGAERLGFELTYYWETIGPEFLRWAGAQAARGPVAFALPIDSVNHDLLREWGAIPPGVEFVDLNSPPSGPPIEPDYYVLQRRRGLYYPADRWLDRYGHPVFSIRRQGVDLLRVYRSEEEREAFAQTRNQPIPRHLLR